MSKAFRWRVLLGVPAVLVVQYLIHAQANLREDVGSVGAFVGAMGTLYSVLAGFTVITVWQQFIDTDRAVKREARGLRELWRYVGYVEDAVGAALAREAIEQYRNKWSRQSGTRWWHVERRRRQRTSTSRWLTRSTE